jgi:hypothetical protein
VNLNEIVIQVCYPTYYKLIKQLSKENISTLQFIEDNLIYYKEYQIKLEVQENEHNLIITNGIGEVFSINGIQKLSMYSKLIEIFNYFYIDE